MSKIPKEGTSLQLQNMKKLKGGPFVEIKTFEKKSQRRKKIERGDPLVSSSFVGYVLKVKNERGGSFGDKKSYLEKVKKKVGNLWTKFALAAVSALGVGGFRIVSKKWTDQCEDCSLKKKCSVLKSGIFP